MTKDSAGNKEGDVPVGKPSPPAHKEDEWDDQVDGQPPTQRVFPASDSPHSKRQFDKESRCQEGGKQEGIVSFNNHGRLM